MQKRLTPVARKLRRDKTDAEALLWSRLRNRQLENAKFRFQAPFDDKDRDAVMEAAGYRVIRFWNSEVFGNLEGVLEEIRQAVLANDGLKPLTERD